MASGSSSWSTPRPAHVETPSIAGKLAAALAEATGQDVDAQELDIDRLVFDSDGTSITFQFDGQWWKCDLASYGLEKTAPEDVPSASLRPFRFPRPGRQTGEDTSITFINRTDKPIEVYWVQSGGQRQHYATVAPGQRHRQHTFAGHAWLVTEKGGKVIAGFTAEANPGDAIIDENTARQAAAGRGPRGFRRPSSRGQSPDGKWSIAVKEHNLVLKNTETDEETALTEDGTEDNAYSGRVYWSPDSDEVRGHSHDQR